MHMPVWHKKTIRHHVFILELYPMIRNFVNVYIYYIVYTNKVPNIYFIFMKHNHYNDLQLFSVNLVQWYMVIIRFKTYLLNNT